MATTLITRPFRASWLQFMYVLPFDDPHFLLPNVCVPPGNRVFDRCSFQPLDWRQARSPENHRAWRCHHDRWRYSPSDVVQLCTNGSRANCHRFGKWPQRGWCLPDVCPYPIHYITQTSTVPSYHAECSPAARRGSLIMIEGSLITFGIMVS